MCVITLTEFHGITGPGGAYVVGTGIPPYIRVSGTMSGCPPQLPGWAPTVSVAVTCSGVISGVSVDAAGRWSVDLPNNEHCACSDPTLRSITVTCDNDPTCAQTFMKMLDCSPPPCPAGTPLGTITIAQSPNCNAAGQRDVTATVALNPGWSVVLLEWSWDGTANVASSPPASTTSPPRALSAGGSHSVAVRATLAAPNSHCHYMASQPFPVAACPTTPPGGGVCIVSIVAALIALAIGSTGLAVGGCLGPAGAGIMATSAGIAAGGLGALGLWILLCHDCFLMRFLQRFFGAMALLMVILAALFTMFGLVPCSVGAGAVGFLFGAIVATVSFGIAVFNCP